MIDGDGSGDYDEIGEVMCTMGDLMGARSQVYQANLSHKGNANCGQIVVRTEAVAQSNTAVKFGLRVQSVNNVGGGCMGMCAEPFPYYVQISKEVAGSDAFVTAARFPGMLRGDGQLPAVVFSLTQLCNANPDLRLKFSLRNANTNAEFNSFVATLS